MREASQVKHRVQPQTGQAGTERHQGVSAEPAASQPEPQSASPSGTEQGQEPPEWLRDVMVAARGMDWMQVVLNQGPPCFHIDKEHEGLRFCGRAQRWMGHTDSDKYPDHRFVSLFQMLATLMMRAKVYRANDPLAGIPDPAAAIAQAREALRLAYDVLVAAGSHGEVLRRVAAALAALEGK